MQETLREMTARGTPPAWLYRLRRELGCSVFRLNIPSWPHFVVVCDHETARNLLLQPLSEKPPIYTTMARVTGGTPNMFTKKTFGQEWSPARKGSAHAFTSARISANMGASAPHLADLDSIMTRHAEKQEALPVSETMVRLTVDIIGSTGFGGFQMKALMGTDESSEGREFMRNLELALLEYTSKQALNPLRSFAIWNQEVANAKVASKRLVQFAQRILDAYRSSDKFKRDKDSLICYLCSNDMYKSDRERCADVIMYLIAGHDTTGYTLAWILCELARRPDIQDKLAADVVAKGCEGPYLQQVIKEGLRLHPVAALGSIRTSSEDLRAPDGSVIPAGSTCLIPFYVMFREAWIEEAEMFVPERWAEAAPQRRELEKSVFPFSLGKRDCIGQRMAMSQLKTVLAHIMSRYRLTMAREPTADYFLTLKPAGALLHVAPR